MVFGVDHTLIMEIAGLLPGSEYDALFGALGTSTAELDGILNIDLFDGFMPSNGDIFNLMFAESISGSFSLLDFPTLTNGLTWDLNTLNDFNGSQDLLRLSVSSVPIPAGIWLFGSGLLGLVGIARRKKVD